MSDDEKPVASTLPLTWSQGSLQGDGAKIHGRSLVIAPNDRETAVFSAPMVKTCGSCVAAGTLVLVDGTVRPIEQLAEEGATTFVNGAWHNIAAWAATGERDLLEVHTTTGGRFRVTPEHKVFTDTGWREACDLAPNDFLEGLLSVQLSHVDLVERLEAELMGILIGDGWFTGATVGFCFEPCMEPVWAPLLRFAAARFESTERPRIRRRDPTTHDALVASPPNATIATIEWRGKGARKFIVDNDLRKDRIPDKIWLSSPGVQGAFLRGLFSTDGSVNVSPRPDRLTAVSFYQTSRALCEQVRLMLRLLGIHNRTHTIKRAPRYKDLHVVQFTRKPGLARFAELAGFRDSYRNDILCEVVKAAYEPRDATERVKSVKPAGRGLVYDISVPATESFHANGVLVHNCRFYRHAITQREFEKTQGSWFKQLVREMGWKLRHLGAHPRELARCGQKDTVLVGPHSRACEYHKS